MLDRILVFFGLRRASYVAEVVEAVAKAAYAKGYQAGHCYGYALGEFNTQNDIVRRMSPDYFSEEEAVRAASRTLN